MAGGVHIQCFITGSELPASLLAGHAGTHDGNPRYTDDSFTCWRL